MTIAILDAKTMNPGDLSWEPFKSLGKLKIYDHSPEETIVERAIDAEIVLVNKVELTADIIQHLPKLKYIGVTATGYNNVDLEAARKRNIPVCNAPGYGTFGVAQHVFALILAICSKVTVHDQAVSNNEWSDQTNFSLVKKPIIGLENKTLGVIGLGSIGEKVAQIGLTFGMKVIANNRSNKKIPNIEMMTVDDILSKSDFISLNCSLNDSNKEMVNATFLNAMKSSAYLINTARGGLINEAHLANALQEKIIAGAAIDVMQSEPPLRDHPLFQLSNCIITPHNAWAYPSSRQNLMEIVLNNINAYLEGKPLNLV